jgi:hypothetical protein
VFDQERFFEVVKPIATLRVVVSHEENNTGAVFHPVDQGEMIRAEVKHGFLEQKRGESPFASRPVRSAVEGLTRRTPPVVGYHHRAAPFMNHSGG